MPVVPISTAQRFAKSPIPGRAPPPEPWALMAAAQMHSEGRLVEPNSMSGEEATVREYGSARFDPEQASDKGKALLQNLPDDIERIEHGNTIELRKKQPALKDLTS